MTDITEIEVVEQGPAGPTGDPGVVQSVAGLAQATITVAELQAALSLAACAYLDVGTGLASSGGNLNVSGLTTSEFAANVVDTDATLAANSDTRLASQKAIKTYADQLIAANDAMVFEGVIDCSADPNYPAADRGATYRVSVAGKIGGVSGVNVEAGDILLCLTDGTASGDQATVGSEWSIIQTNIDGAVVGPASATDGHVALFDGATGKLIKDGGAATTAGLAMLSATDAAAQAALLSLSPSNSPMFQAISFGALSGNYITADNLIITQAGYAGIYSAVGSTVIECYSTGAGAVARTASLRTLIIGSNYVHFNNVGQISWASSGLPAFAAGDTVISRSGAGIVAISASGSALGDGSVIAKSYKGVTKAGAPTTSDLAAGYWQVFKDSSGGGVIIAYNDAGTIVTGALA